MAPDVVDQTPGRDRKRDLRAHARHGHHNTRAGIRVTLTSPAGTVARDDDNGGGHAGVSTATAPGRPGVPGARFPKTATAACDDEVYARVTSSPRSEEALAAFLAKQGGLGQSRSRDTAGARDTQRWAAQLRPAAARLLRRVAVRVESKPGGSFSNLNEFSNGESGRSSPLANAAQTPFNWLPREQLLGPGRGLQLRDPARLRHVRRSRPATARRRTGTAIGQVTGARRRRTDARSRDHGAHRLQAPEPYTADGPPCRRSFADVHTRHLLRYSRRSSQRRPGGGPAAALPQKRARKQWPSSC